MSFPGDIKNCMKDCILSLLWPRKDIYNFFRDNGCTKDDLKVLARYDDESMSRSKMVDTMFDYLTGRPDTGLGQFRVMFSALLKWSHFDPYYFDTLGKLNRQTATSNLDRLRHLQEIRDAKIHQQKEQRIKREQEAQKAQRNIEELKETFVSLYFASDTKQERGYELERVLQDLAKLSNLEVTQPFRCRGEQIDGAIKFDGENYIFEAKWQDKEASNEPVYQFAGKVEGKMYGRGIFVSIRGYSENVVRSLVVGKALRTILVDAEDLILVLEERLSFREMLDRKVRAAQNDGYIYVNPLTEVVKIPH